MRNDVIVAIPSKRPPPLATLESYAFEGLKVVIVADPRTYDQTRDYYHNRKRQGVSVALGDIGMSPQVLECYRYARLLGYDWYLRLDDDLTPKTFVHRDGRIIQPEEAVNEALQCAIATGCSLVGFQNSKNRFWMSEGFSRSFGLVHGGAHLCRSSADPDRFLDPAIVRYEDVYRSCAHREKDGAVGRVRYIGIDKSQSTFTSATASSIGDSATDRDNDIKRILARFADFVEVKGMKPVTANSDHLIVNWRYKRHPGYDGRLPTR